VNRIVGLVAFEQAERDEAFSRGAATVRKSGLVPARTCRQEGQVPQGLRSFSSRVSQRSDWANCWANRRLPIPSGPVKRNVLPSRFWARALRKCATRVSWPRRLSQGIVAGRQERVERSRATCDSMAELGRWYHPLGADCGGLWPRRDYCRAGGELYSERRN